MTGPRPGDPLDCPTVPAKPNGNNPLSSTRSQGVQERDDLGLLGGASLRADLQELSALDRREEHPREQL